MSHAQEEGNSFNERDENLKAENAVIKLKLELDYGMKMSETGSLNAALENSFLAGVLKFEQNLKKNQQKITIHKFLGSPEFPGADDLTKPQISAELLRVNQAMANKGIMLDCIHKYDDEEIYRFIVEELFFHPTNDFMMSGVVCHFIYEEFLDNEY